jgi:DNA-directed RNA polymerase subunit M/transcription elongation factor TFIIS
MDNYCLECGGILFYDISTKRYTCKSCGIYVTKDQLSDLKDKIRKKDGSKSKKHERSEYLEWWLSKKS